MDCGRWQCLFVDLRDVRWTRSSRQRYSRFGNLPSNVENQVRMTADNRIVIMEATAWIPNWAQKCRVRIATGLRTCIWLHPRGSSADLDHKNYCCPWLSHKIHADWEQLGQKLLQPNGKPHSNILYMFKGWINFLTTCWVKKLPPHFQGAPALPKDNPILSRCNCIIYSSEFGSEKCVGACTNLYYGQRQRVCE